MDGASTPAQARLCTRDKPKSGSHQETVIFIRGNSAVRGQFNRWDYSALSCKQFDPDIFRSVGLWPEIRIDLEKLWSQLPNLPA